MVYSCIRTSATKIWRYVSLNIVVYTKSNCPHCYRALSAAQQLVQEQKALSLEIINCDDPGNRDQLLTEAPNARTMPQVFVDGKSIGGADAFIDWITLTGGGSQTLLI